jgi:hypothetical protein
VVVSIGNTTIPTHNNTITKHNRNLANIEVQSLSDRLMVKQQTLMDGPPNLDESPIPGIEDSGILNNKLSSQDSSSFMPH